jgi:hypothetical protein
MTQALFDIEEIKRLKARYFRFLNGEDWEGFRSLFLDDSNYDIEGQVYAGADAFVGAVIRHHTRARVRTVHHGHMPEIELTDGDHATGVWALWDFVDRVWNDDGRREAFVGYGHYHERYRKVDDVWRIAEMRITRIRVDPLSPDQLVPFPERGERVHGIFPPAAPSGDPATD